MDNNTENLHLREYIYIDNVEINSILAQLYRGLKIKTTSSTSKKEGAAKEHAQNGKLTAGGNYGIPLLAQGKGDVALSIEHKTTSNVESLDQESVEAVLSDYSVEVLENDLKEQGLLINVDNAKVGDIIHIKESFNITDFSSMKDSTKPELISKILGVTANEQTTEISQQIKAMKSMGASSKDLNPLNKQLHDLKKTIDETQKAVSENFQNLNLLGQYGATLFKDSILINGESYISYAELSNFRLSKPQLNMLHDSPRNLNVIGIIENEFENVSSLKNGDFEETAPSNLGKTPNMLLKTILASFDLGRL